MSCDETGAVRVEVGSGTAWITLNRPQSINAINDEIRGTLPARLFGLNADPAVRVLVLRGAGSRGFCVGADLKEERPTHAPPAPWIEALTRLDKPLIASIHGFCLGGGLELALASDIRVASVDARFGLPEPTIGLIAGAGGTQRLPRIVGLGRALDLLLSAERIDAMEALRIGLISRLAATQEGLHKITAELARTIASLPPLAVRAAKHAALRGMELELDAGLKLERTLFSSLVPTRDHQEAIAAFREKRSPVFTGE